MPKIIPKQELDAIVAIVAAHPAGVRVVSIREGLVFDLPPRMLQRRLALLIEQKRIAVEGRGRGCRYKILQNGVDVPTARLTIEGRAPQVEIYIPLSAEGETIRAAVSEPIQNRRPVGYNRHFLDEYQPNDTFYLSAEIRLRLLKMRRPLETGRPAGTYARKIFSRLLIDLSWNSSRLEGNTYSQLETERLLKLAEAAAGKDALETLMILNHKAAIELLVEQVTELGFNPYTILNLHALLSDSLFADPRSCGQLRENAVELDDTVYHPLEAPHLIDECFQQVLDTVAAITDPFEQAFFCMVHLPYLHPFEDVNKRVSRLAANLSLIRENLSPLSFVDVPESVYMQGLLGVYELNRVELLRDVFVWAYVRSCARYSGARQPLGEPDPFRLRNRDQIIGIVAELVRNGVSKKAATTAIKQYALKNVKESDQRRFLEVVETELMSLHEGNIARYRLRLPQYYSWRESW
jgi:fido (protein-threonine AMPylation protein)